MICVEVRCGYS